MSRRGKNRRVISDLDINFARRAAEILEFLMQNEGYQTPAAICLAVYGTADKRDIATFRVQIANIRSLLRIHHAGDRLVNKRSEGYAYVAPSSSKESA